MSSPLSRGRPNHKKHVSADGLDSFLDSEEPVISVIRLPQAQAFPSSLSPFLGVAPPPLPPKPAFARGLPHSAPPPLPLKPENVRAEKVLNFIDRGRPALPVTPTFFFDPAEPTRPPPAVPNVPKSDRKPSYEDCSWGPNYLDERSQQDPPQPPEPTIVSDGDPMRSSVGRDFIDTSTQSFSDQILSLTFPLPPPPYSAHHHRISSAFQSLSVSEGVETEGRENNLSLSAESAEDAYIGAIVLSRERIQFQPRPSRELGAPVSWQLYQSREPCGEPWNVLHEYLTNVSLKTHGRNRALELLTGYVVGACLNSTEAGIGLLTEIVRRMQGAERSERDGSIFTLLVNIGAHVSFVEEESWSSVEAVVRRVFSDVIEEMHGRQDDDVMWKRALRCFLMLLKSSDRHASEDITSNCLAALALHIGDMTHTDVDHVLISKGLCPRLRHSRDEFQTSIRVNVACLEEIGGLQTILTLFADTTSPSARHSLFGLIYDISVLRCLEGVSEQDVMVLKDHVVAFRELLETHDMADLLVHTFRVGPQRDFVVDVIRILLFSPLSQESHNIMTGRVSDESPNGGKKSFQEKTGSMFMSDTRLSGTIGRAYQESASKYVSSTRALLKLLDRAFCIKVLRQFEELGRQNSVVLAHRESMHYAKEWKVICDIERSIQLFLFSRDMNTVNSIGSMLTKLYVAVVDITSGRSNMKSILRMSEMIIEFFAMKAPFSPQKGTVERSVDSIAKKFLKGELSVSRDMLMQADPSIFTLLLLASKEVIPVRRLSECRQCLIEFLGSCENRVVQLEMFTDDDDSSVAYRAGEIVSKYAEANLQACTSGDGSEKGERLGERG